MKKMLSGLLQILSKTTLDPAERTRIRFSAWTIALILGLLQVIAHADELSSGDGVSYLDIADAYFKQDWNSAINGSWSPLYSWLLGAAIHILRPSIYWEFPVVNLINFILFAFMLLSFEFFLVRLWNEYRNALNQEDAAGFFVIPEGIWLIAGYSLFLWTSLHWVRVSVTTPDMLASAFIFLSTGLLIGICKPYPKWRDFILSGIVLGFGYLAKAPLFLFGVAFFLATLFASRDFRRSFPGTLLGFMTFTLTIAPFVIALSLQKRHLTLGEKGKLSYAWYINPGRGIIPLVNWQGGPEGFGYPKHPTRKIIDDPLIYEFTVSNHATYSPWYDPFYWNEGIRVRFDLKRQLHVLVRNLFFCWQEFFSILIFGYLLLIGVSGNLQMSLRQLLQNWKLLILAITGIGASLVLTDLPAIVIPNQPVTRHLAPYIVVLFAVFFQSLRLNNSREPTPLVTYTIGLAAMIVILTLVYRGTRDFVFSLTNTPSVDQHVAIEIRNMGIRPGDRAVIIGNGRYHIFWARLARVRIMAQAPYVEEFWSVTPSKRESALDLLRRHGANIFVSSPGGKIPDGDPGWRHISGTSYLVRH